MPNADRAFFIDWKTVKIPLRQCFKCKEKFEPESFRPGASICNMCHKKSIANNTFWVGYGTGDRKKVKTGRRSDEDDDYGHFEIGTRISDCDDGNIQNGAHTIESAECVTKTPTDERNTQTETCFSSVDHRTICLDKGVWDSIRTKMSSENLHNLDDFTGKEVTKSKNLLENSLSKTTQIQNSSELEKNEARGLARIANRRRNDPKLNNDSMEAGLLSHDEEISKFGSEQRQTDQCNSELSAQARIQTNASETSRVFGSDNFGSTAFDGSLKHDSNKEHLGEINETGTFQIGVNEIDKFGNEKDAEHLSRRTEADTENNREETRNSLGQKDPEIFAVQHEATEEMRLQQTKGLMQEKDGVCCNMQSLKTVKEFEKARLAMEGLCNDMKRLEGYRLSPDVIDRLSNQSEAEKSKISGQDNKQPATLTENSQAVMDMEEDRGCDRTIVDWISSDVGLDKDTLGSIVDNDRCTSADMDELRNIETGRENTDITPHQVLIVNPFPSPVPTSTAMVNVTSNCHCDRYASLVRNTGNNGKKKGRAKKANGTGGGRNIQRTGGSRLVMSNSRSGANRGNAKRLGQENGVKSKKRNVGVHKDSSQANVQQGVRGLPASRKSKKRLKELQQIDVKEISVTQTELRSDSNDTKYVSAPNNSEVNQEAVGMLFVRQSTFTKDKFSALSPIPEASSTEGSVRASSPDIFSKNLDANSTNSDVFRTNGDSCPSNLETADRLNLTNCQTVFENKNDLHRSLTNHSPSQSDNEIKSTEAKPIPENNELESSATENSRETDDNPVRDKDIYSSFDYTENTSPMSSTDDNETANVNLACSQVGDDDNNLGPPTSEASGRISKSDNIEQLIEAILNDTEELETNHAKPHASRRTNTRERAESSTQAEDSFHKPDKPGNFKMDMELDSQVLVSNWLLKQEHHLANDPLENICNLPSCTLDTSKSSDCTGRDIPGYQDTTGHDDVLLGQYDVICRRKMENNAKSTSFARDWTTSSVAFSLTTTRSGLKSHEGETAGQFKGLVHSRLSGGKSEMSVSGSDTTYSEEEEIVWRRGNMLGKGAFGKVGGVLLTREIFDVDFRLLEYAFERIRQTVA